MKTILLLLIMLTISSAYCQKKVTVDSNGNYISTVKKSTSSSKPTGKLYIDAKGNKYPVFESVNGKLYYNRTSKSGNVYKVYLSSK